MTTKTTYQNYPAYKYNYNGIKFLVFNSNYDWYMVFQDRYFISERQESQSFKTKKHCIETAKFYINEKTN